MFRYVCIICLLGLFQPVSAQFVPLDKKAHIEAVNVHLRSLTTDGKQCLEVLKNEGVYQPSQPTYAKIKDVSFINGTIELEVYSSILQGAPEAARGFIGVAFRINNDNTSFECIYIRPRNGRDPDQLRRNHSTQYFAYPDHPFSKLRKEYPGTYESYADMELNTWIPMRIEIHDRTARLYLNGDEQPSLIVNDLKNAFDTKGSIGLFVDNGTQGYFRNLKVTVLED
ncbi:family 16 glycoside hydrolase [Flagellimonas aequoris]|uniref:3-keto-alpha-glucoside-1,2-lyase/3-keto-2-hydroxy-glucal hydratase domain-containing protein n=1 Tax=Flagellimonas aequoris TaxID=2306997 RepID=A0A418N889_9FLAO|nr:hypothetical protein [Allomuricauda aequoris]RIV71564.1 hypothetical protein D2U88_07300 [Allomuricauda aequoris]TXK03128.1 hypothetical protein FQ019_07245 [Allomuricauda aequoris]